MVDFLVRFFLIFFWACDQERDNQRGDQRGDQRREGKKRGPKGALTMTLRTSSSTTLKLPVVVEFTIKVGGINRGQKEEKEGRK